MKNVKGALFLLVLVVALVWYWAGSEQESKTQGKEEIPTYEGWIYIDVQPRPFRIWIPKGWRHSGRNRTSDYFSGPSGDLGIELAWDHRSSFPIDPFSGNFHNPENILSKGRTVVAGLSARFFTYEIEWTGVTHHLRQWFFERGDMIGTLRCTRTTNATEHDGLFDTVKERLEFTGG